MARISSFDFSHGIETVGKSVLPPRLPDSLLLSPSFKKPPVESHWYKLFFGPSLEDSLLDSISPPVHVFDQLNTSFSDLIQKAREELERVRKKSKKKHEELEREGKSEEETASALPSEAICQEVLHSLLKDLENHELLADGRRALIGG